MTTKFTALPRSFISGMNYMTDVADEFEEGTCMSFLAKVRLDGRSRHLIRISPDLNEFYFSQNVERVDFGLAAETIHPVVPFSHGNVEEETRENASIDFSTNIESTKRGRGRVPSWLTFLSTKRWRKIKRKFCCNVSRNKSQVLSALECEFPI